MCGVRILKRVSAVSLLLAMTLTLTGCFTEFEPDIKSDPVLCLNSVIEPEDTIRVQVTRTWRWSEGDVNEGYNYHPDYDLVDVTVRDATVRLYVNGEYKEDLRLVTIHEFIWGQPYGVGKDVYEARYIPSVGDHIRIEAESPEYGEAYAEVVVPEAVPIDKVDFFATKEPANYDTDHEYQFYLATKVWFRDPADRTNYYLVEAGTSPSMVCGEDADGNPLKEYAYNASFVFEDEPLFTEHVSALEGAFGETWGYTIFSDRQISGNEYPLTIKLNPLRYYYGNFKTGWSNLDDKGNLTDQSEPIYTGGEKPDYSKIQGYISFILYSVSESYYKHVLSVWEANDGITGVLGGVGLGDLVYASSNVSTGAGVVAARTPSVYKLPVSEIFKRYPPEERKSPTYQYIWD